ncbi:MAG: FtsX-like permease family protein [Candidatus Krumholzibacteriota bacterium]|nr:FtsX-like permease family protein [Candidatus Krumholzibacteriota bacterium]
MIRFLLKGLIRDRHRSLFPVMVVTVGVTVAILMQTFMHGVMDDMVRSNAKLDTGHLKVTTLGYREIARQMPNDLSISGIDRFLRGLETDYPRLEWTTRIKFGGILDIPDEAGETRSQGPAIGLAIDLLSEKTREIKRLQLAEALVRGRLPADAGEVLISDEFAHRLGAEIGETATLITSTAQGGMAVHNFVIAGTVRFGMAALDRNTVIADITDMQYVLDMEGSASEVLGFFPNLVYDDRQAEEIVREFNDRHSGGGEDDFLPVMQTLRMQNNLGEYLDLAAFRVAIILVTFFAVMSIVLWNAGLMAGIRRYGEIGVRLAIGESKHQVYWRLLAESFLVGLTGSAIGTALGLAVSYYMQEVGIDISGMLQGSSILMGNIMRAHITPASYYLGFIPGLAATFFGSAVSGIGIFRRQTAQLFKELEA